MSEMIRVQIQRLDRDLAPISDAIVVAQFNPGEITFDKKAVHAEIPIPGLDVPLLQYVRGEAETVSLDLFFDTTDRGMGEDATPVTLLTDQVYALLRLDPDTGGTPVCNLSWGQVVPGRHLPSHLTAHVRHGVFTCVFQELSQKFTLFSPQGVPLRATLTARVKEYRTLAHQVDPESAPPHVEEMNVRNAAELAAALLEDPARWRDIAEDGGLAENLIETAVGAAATAAVIGTQFID